MCAFCKRISSRSLLFLQESSNMYGQCGDLRSVNLSFGTVVGLSDMDRHYMSKASSKLLEECLKVYSVFLSAIACIYRIYWFWFLKNGRSTLNWINL